MFDQFYSWFITFYCTHFTRPIAICARGSRLPGRPHESSPIKLDGCAPAGLKYLSEMAHPHLGSAVVIQPATSTCQEREKKYPPSIRSCVTDLRIIMLCLYRPSALTCIVSGAGTMGGVLYGCGGRIDKTGTVRIRM